MARYVRTEAGAKRYKLPIGSPIGKGGGAVAKLSGDAGAAAKKLSAASSGPHKGASAPSAHPELFAAARASHDVKKPAEKAREVAPAKNSTAAETMKRASATQVESAVTQRHVDHLEGLAADVKAGRGGNAREAADKYLAGVKGKELDALASHYNQRGRTVADKRANIRELTVGRVADSKAIQRVVRGEASPRSSAGGSPSDRAAGGALSRIESGGVRSASEADLRAALSDPSIGGMSRTEINVELRRRSGATAPVKSAVATRLGPDLRQIQTQLGLAHPNSPSTSQAIGRANESLHRGAAPADVAVELRRQADSHEQQREELRGTDTPEINASKQDVRLLRRLADALDGQVGPGGDGSEKATRARRSAATALSPDSKATQRMSAAQKTASSPNPSSGRMSTKPLLENNWGTPYRGAGTVNYHADGSIGQAVARMGNDAHLEVEGDALGNVLGKLATDGVMGRKSEQEVLDRLKQVRDELPADSKARRSLDMAVSDMDAPDSPTPNVPNGTPVPLKQLMSDLHAIPLERRDPKEEDQLSRILANFADGKIGGLRFFNELRQLRNQRHESVEGKFDVDRAVDKALSAMEKLGRKALYPA